MENDVGMRKLLEFIFVNKFRIEPEMRASDSSFPVCLLRNHFPQKLRYVLFVSHVIVYLKWIVDFDTRTTGLLDYDETYLHCIIYNCFVEHYSQENIFDSLINVCGFVRFFSHETFLRRDNEYDDFNFNIAMEFYESVLKEDFNKKGGFPQLVEHILNHDYLSWKFETIDLTFVNDPSTSLHIETAKKLKEEVIRADKALHSANFVAHALNVAADSIAQKVLSATSNLSPTFPNYQELDDTSKPIVKEKTAEIRGTIEADPKIEPLEADKRKCLNLDSKIDRIPQQKTDVTSYERIVQAVMKNNHLKSSYPQTSDNYILKKSEEILEHFKNTIESLIGVLEENGEKWMF